ncbi:MAG: hypothetical protein K2R98_31345 [Gemmataceae bacterium]|nr:hypothetical protein [Gemmataceae bacterium]
MSTAPPPAPTPAPAALSSDQQEIKIISHSNLFYWWPVWAVGLLMALLTFMDGHIGTVVPPKSEAHESAEVTTKGGGTTFNKRDVIVLPAPKEGENRPAPHLKLHMSHSSSYGVIWATTLLLVITITNVPLRGMWSVVVIVVAVLMSIIFALAGWWDTIFFYMSALDIRINAGGYLFVSLVLLAIWLVTMILFDRQIYMIFTPGQLRVCQEIGGGESSYDTAGMVVMKQRSDLFRHWILGLGSGDLVVRTSGANSHEFQMHNVLFVGRKLQLIEQMQRDRPVVRGAV